MTVVSRDSAVLYEDIRKHGACVARGHDLRQVGDSPYYNCKCGASARVKDGRIELDHGQPKTIGEKRAENQARRERYERSR